MDETASLLGADDAGKEMVDIQALHRDPHMEIVHCAREAAFAAKAAKQLGATTKVDTVKHLADAAANSAKFTEFLARKLACRLNLPVQSGEPFLPTLARAQADWMLCLALRRSVNEFI